MTGTPRRHGSSLKGWFSAGLSERCWAGAYLRARFGAQAEGQGTGARRRNPEPDERDAAGCDRRHYGLAFTERALHKRYLLHVRVRGAREEKEISSSSEFDAYMSEWQRHRSGCAHARDTCRQGPCKS